MFNMIQKNKKKIVTIIFILTGIELMMVLKLLRGLKITITFDYILYLNLYCILS